jgi:acetylornithine deacetylase/succinyl-diaminopimelate desuccinylase-like protein
MGNSMKIAATWLLLALAAAAQAQVAPLRPDQAAFRELFEELVETNTTLSSGSCTLAAERMAARLKTAGFPDSLLTLFATPEHPKEGGLVAVYPGTSATIKPLLLIAHIDVVEARREDWERDPFTLIEENGYFYARGVADTKALAAGWVDALIRFRQQGYVPKRTIKVALTCGEETNGAFNGIEWLAANRRELIEAEFDLHEGGGGDSDGKGKVIGQSVQIGEKTFANFRLETRNPGGHSSTPVRDNAIYQLSRALLEIDGHEFPLEMTDTTRRYFKEAGAARTDDIGRPWSRWPRTRGTRRPRRSSTRTASFIPICARLVWRPCWTPATRPTRCRSVRAPTSTAGSFPAIRSRRSGASWPP